MAEASDAQRHPSSIRPHTKGARAGGAVRTASARPGHNAASEQPVGGVQTRSIKVLSSRPGFPAAADAARPRPTAVAVKALLRETHGGFEIEHGRRRSWPPGDHTSVGAQRRGKLEKPAGRACSCCDGCAKTAAMAAPSCFSRCARWGGQPGDGQRPANVRIDGFTRCRIDLPPVQCLGRGIPAAIRTELGVCGS